MDLYLNVKNFNSPKQVTKSFFGIKDFKAVMTSFPELKTLRVVRQWWSSLLVLKALRAAGVFRHAAVQNIFGNSSGRVLMLVMTACGNFAFIWIFWPIFWSIFTKYST